MNKTNSLNLKNSTYLYLLPPEELFNNHELDELLNKRIKVTLQQLKETLTTNKLTLVRAKIKGELEQLSQFEIFSFEEEILTTTNLKPKQVQEFDQYMEVFRVKTKEKPKLMVRNLLQSYLLFLELNQNRGLEPCEIQRLQSGISSYIGLLNRLFKLPNCNDSDLNTSILPITTLQICKEMNPMEVWKKSHWLFIVLCQGLIICLKRFIDEFQSNRLDIAKIELSTAAELMWASGATMKLAGSFSRQQYESDVRPTMTPGHPESLVKSEPLSGLMMWEHDYLVNVIWKKQLSPILKNLPATLREEHAEFVRAYQHGLSNGHKSVCAKFGGGEMGALTSSPLQSNVALDNLEKFEHSRLKVINPQNNIPAKCPFHHT